MMSNLKLFLFINFVINLFYVKDNSFFNFKPKYVHHTHLKAALLEVALLPYSILLNRL